MPSRETDFFLHVNNLINFFLLSIYSKTVDGNLTPALESTALEVLVEYLSCRTLAWGCLDGTYWHDLGSRLGLDD